MRENRDFIANLLRERAEQRRLLPDPRIAPVLTEPPVIPPVGAMQPEPPRIAPMMLQPSAAQSAAPIAPPIPFDERQLPVNPQSFVAPPMQPIAPMMAPPDVDNVAVPSIAAPVAPPIVPTEPTLEQQLAASYGKDYSIKKDDAGNVIHRGKDRKKEWSLLDKIGAAAVGWFQNGLAGGIAGATDRNFFRKMGDQNQRARLIPAIQAEQQRDQFKLGQETRRIANQNIIDDNVRMNRDLERKREADASRSEHAKATLADKSRGRDMTARQIDDLARYRDFLIENGTKMTDARIKQIDERLEDYDLDRVSREKIAGMGQAGQDRRQQIALAAQAKAAEVRAAEASKNMERASELRKELAEIQAQYKALAAP